MTEPHRYSKLAVQVDRGVAIARITNPPLNLITLELMSELLRFAHGVAADPAVRALVLRSDVPGFWLAHFDVAAILRFPTDGPATLARRVEENPYHGLCELLRTMPKATIAEIGGRVGGGGSELAMSCDMRFGALGQTIVSQPEVALGILPGGTGTQRMPRLIGRGRALELILGCDELDAATAERWGWLDRALPPAELRPFVDRLARRIASFPASAIEAAKRATLAAEPSWESGLLLESHLFQGLLRTPEAQARMRRFLELGGQTLEVERELGRVCERLADGDA